MFFYTETQSFYQEQKKKVLCFSSPNTIINVFGKISISNPEKRKKVLILNTEVSGVTEINVTVFLLS